MKIAHEAPLDIMNVVRLATDYDYFLAHLFENEDYKKFYTQSQNMGRHTILDNSVFELGTAFDSNRFAELVLELKPTEYIIPDVIGDSAKSIDLINKWTAKYPKGHFKGSKAIGVVQGKSVNELTSSYWFLDNNPYIDKIAFAFMSDAYEKFFYHPNVHLSRAMGRVHFLSWMVNRKSINFNKPHHLLGTYCPIEFSFYGKDFSWIDTIDTSAPVALALEGRSLEKEMKTLAEWKKPNTKIDKIFLDKVSQKESVKVVKEINNFKKLIS